MDEPRRTPGSPLVPWTPEQRPEPPRGAVSPYRSTPPPPDPPPSRGRTVWTRLTRTTRGAVGLGIGAAALLLWPFSGWSLLPWLGGVAALVLLALLRLDRLLSGWVWHLAGLVVVAGLMVSTTPWAWGLAASIGVLVAGLLRLPEWRLAAVGAVLCVVSGVAYTLVTVQDAREAAAQQVETSEQSRGMQGAPRPYGVLPVLLGRIASGSAGPVCDNLLAEPARAAFAASVGQPDCPAAVAALAAQVVDRNDYEDADAPAQEQGDGLVVDACAMTWSSGTPAGPQLGVLTIGRAPTGPTYVVTAFAPC
ncbi:hypothetical protein ACVGOW_33380 [Pseudonocardia saturnea]